MHLMTNRGKSAGRAYFFKYHNDDSFGFESPTYSRDKPKVKNVLIPHLLRRDKIQGI